MSPKKIILCNLVITNSHMLVGQGIASQHTPKALHFCGFKK